MALTALSDVFVKETSTPAIKEATRSVGIFSTPVFARGPIFDKAATEAADVVKVPAWRALGGNSRVQSTSSDTPVGKVSQSVQIAPMVRVEEAFGANAFATALASEDPLKYAAKDLGVARALAYQPMFAATMSGFFKTAAAAAKHVIAVEVVGDVTDAAKLSVNAILDTLAKAGEFKGMFTGATIYCHSAVETALNKLEATTVHRNSEGVILMTTWRGMQVVVDDSLVRPGATSGYVYQTYILAKESIATGEAEQVVDDVGVASVQIEKNAAGNTKALFDRNSTFFSPRGAKWVGTLAEGQDAVTAEDLADGDNWQLVLDAKRIGMLCLEHNL